MARDEIAAETAGDQPTTSRLFVSLTRQQRVRRAGDTVLVGLGLVLLAINAWQAGRAGRFEASVFDIVGSLPSWAHELFAITFASGAVYALTLVLASVLRRAPLWDVTRDLVLAVATAIVVGLILVRMIDGAWPVVFPELGIAEPAARFPVIRVAVVTAIVVASGPHVLRPFRRLGWVFVTLVVISGMGLGLGLPTDALGGVGLGLAAAGLVLVSFGSPGGFPNRQRIRTDLADLGMSVGELLPADDQTWGARSLVGTDDGGRSVLVKVYGSDARDAQFFAKLWRFVWYRDTGGSLTFSRLQLVEHEALVTLLASRAGVSCPAVLIAATSKGDDAVLVNEKRGRSFAQLEPGDVSDEMLTDMWRQIVALHAASISHGALNVNHVHFDGPQPLISGFQTGSLSATPAQVATDIAELLVSTADYVGVHRAVQGALAGLGSGGLIDAVPYIQVPALTTATRKSADDLKNLIKTVQTEVIATTEIEPPEPAELRRVKVRDLVITGLIVFAAYYMINLIAGLDVASVWASLKSAELGWALAALIAAQLILIPNATGMMAAVSAPIPLRPTVILQSAIQFVALAVPSSAGRIATNVAYLRKFGVSSVTAVTQGALDSFTGFLVQMAILAGALLFGDVMLQTSGDIDVNWGRILVIVLVVLVAGIVVAWMIESVRTRIVGLLREAVGAVGELLKAPRRAIVLFSSNFGTQFVLAITMWLTVRAFGETISLMTSLVVVVVSFVLAGFAPTPGGVGVAEAVLAAGLVSAGLDQDTAFAAAVAYRLVTFFLPPAWGLFSLRWLEKNGYL